MATVRFENATRIYPGNDSPSVDKLNIDIADGKFLVLVGPSGCGKSTSLRMLAGLEEVNGGDIWIGDRNVTDLSPKDRDVAMVFQNYALYPHMTVADNMGFALKIAGESKDKIREKVTEAAKILDLVEYLDRKPKALSGGQRQRVAMGRAIVRSPQVFLMDEPLSNLDAKLRVAMRTEIKALHQRLKTTSIYVTHDQIEAMTMADKIVVMNAGKMEQVGSPLDLYDNPANLFVAGFIGSPTMNFITGKVNGSSVAIAPGIELPLQAKTRLESNRDVIVGVRPEHLAVSATGLPVEVVVVEPTGADTQIFCKLARFDINAVVRERHEFHPGESIRLAPQLTFLFDPASGARLA